MIYTVESAVKKADKPDKGSGPMQVINLLLVAEGATPVDAPVNAEWYTRGSTPVPAAGSKLDGDVTQGQYGPAFKKAAGGGGWGGGGGPRPEDPKKSAAIQRMASVKAAHQSAELAITLSVVEAPKTPEDLLKLVQRFADFWDRDVAKVKDAA